MHFLTLLIRIIVIGVALWLWPLSGAYPSGFPAGQNMAHWDGASIDDFHQSASQTSQRQSRWIPDSRHMPDLVIRPPREVSNGLVPAYFGERQIESIQDRIEQIKTSMDEFLALAMEKLVRVFRFIGVILILVCTGFIVTYVREMIPTVSSRAVFGFIFVLVCLIWIKVTDAYTSAFYAAAILAVPPIILLIGRVLLRWFKDRFAPKNRYVVKNQTRLASEDPVQMQQN